MLFIVIIYLLVNDEDIKLALWTVSYKKNYKIEYTLINGLFQLVIWLRSKCRLIEDLDRMKNSSQRLCRPKINFLRHVITGIAECSKILSAKYGVSRSTCFQCASSVKFTVGMAQRKYEKWDILRVCIYTVGILNPFSHKLKIVMSYLNSWKFHTRIYHYTFITNLTKMVRKMAKNGTSMSFTLLSHQFNLSNHLKLSGLVWLILIFSLYKNGFINLTVNMPTQKKKSFYANSRYAIHTATFSWFSLWYSYSKLHGGCSLGQFDLETYNFALCVSGQMRTFSALFVKTLRKKIIIGPS